MTRAWEVFRFELAYQIGRGSTRIYFLLFLVFSGLVAQIFLLDAREDGYFFNAPIITAATTLISSMLALLVIAGMAGDAATRDAQLRIDSFLYTTPLRKAAYIVGRFFGTFVVTALLLIAVPIALLLMTQLPLEPELLGPFRPDAYLTAYFLFALPNAFVATAVLFSIAALTRRITAAYAGAGFLFFAAFFSETFLAARLGQWGLGKLIDPMGYTTLRAVWTASNPTQKNALPVPLDGEVLSNRLFWLGLAVTMLAFAYARIRFAYDAGSRGGKRAAVVEDVAQVRWSGVVIPPARRVFGARTRIRQLLRVAGESFRELHTGRAWLVVPFMALIFILTGPELLEVELGTPGAATSARVADMFGAFENTILITILVALSTGQLVWRERDARIHAIADVAPVPEWLSYLGKFLGLALMLAAAMLIFTGAGIVVQVMEGGAGQIDLLHYAKILFGFQYIHYLLIAVLAMLVHVLVNQKYVGIVLTLVAIIGTDIARELGVRHKLLLFGNTPRWSYSEMGGFGVQVGPWFWFTLYWSGWGLLLAVVAYLFWIRGEERGVRRRIALARQRLRRWPAAIGATALAVIIGVGGFVFYNTNVLNRYRTNDDVERQRAEYERRYGKYASLPQPTLAATKLHVDFHPQRYAATVRGSYRLDNRTASAIDAIHLVVHPDLATTNVGFDRPARATVTDDEIGYRIYALDRALQPGESIRMDFQVDYAQRGFVNEGRNDAVMPNGSWIQHRAEQRHGLRQWLPFVGYQQNNELHSPAQRKEHGLRARPSYRPLDYAPARLMQLGNEKIVLETIIGTDADQMGVAPGALQRRWTENGRNYSHYVTDGPITNGYAIFSAKYAIHRAQWKDVDLEIYHHPTHTRNLGRMLKSVRASLEAHTRDFTPYPHRQLRMVESPSFGGGLGLTAFPGTIRYSEGYALVRPEDDERGIDLPFAVMAHEVGHQWWGHQIVPAEVEGGALLSESLAWYTAMLVVEENLGREHLTRLLDMMRREFLAPHQVREVPLLRATDRMDAYRIGPFAMFALREAVGKEKVNLALRNLLAKFDPHRPPYPTSRDLYAELRAVTPPSAHGLLKDLFEDITYWDLRAKGATVHGNRVTVNVLTLKLKGDGTGKEKPAAMDDLIEVAAFDADGKVIYRQPHQFRSGEQTITLTVPRTPARVELDPDHELLDRKPEDNSVAVPAG